MVIPSKSISKRKMLKHEDKPSLGTKVLGDGFLLKLKENVI